MLSRSLHGSDDWGAGSSFCWCAQGIDLRCQDPWVLLLLTADLLSNV